MRAVSVTIGRNVDGEPMSASDWCEFTESVQTLFSEIHYTGESVGAWLNDSGKWERESNYLVQGVASALVDVRERVRILADVYGQEAIALLQGESELVRPARLNHKQTKNERI